MMGINFNGKGFKKKKFMVMQREKKPCFIKLNTPVFFSNLG